MLLEILLPSYAGRLVLSAILCVLVAPVVCQELQEDWPSSYDIGPYKHVYPPTNLSIDQFACVPNPALNTTCPLFIDLIMSFGGAFTSSGVVPAIQVALDQINGSPDLLQGYTLHYTLQDSQCDPTTSLDALHAGLLQPPVKIAVVGSGCSVATEPTAEISHYYNLTQLSCSSSSTELMNRRRFPKHFQMSTAEISLAYGFFGVIQNSKWRKVSIIFQEESLFTITMNELKGLLNATKISYTEIRYERDVDPFSVDPDSRVYVLSMYPEYAREILCKAYQKNKNFRYPRNLFFVNGWYPENWWEGPEEDQALLMETFGCSAEQRKSLVPYTLAVSTSGRVVLNYSAVADNGFTGEEIKSAYEDYLRASLLNVTELFLYQLCYDTIWTLARALDNTLNDLRVNETTSADFGLQNFMYNNSVVLENIFKHLSQTNFNGIVGNIAFNEFGSRKIDTVELSQYRFVGNDEILQSIPVGKVLRKSELVFEVVYFNGSSSIWPDGIPYDGVATETVVSTHVSVTTIFIILATCGIVFATVCVVLNIFFRKKTLIRLTSPYLNCLIGIGAIIFYINMYLYVTHSTDNTVETWICNLDPWLTAIGYSVCYGTILGKMCRVYYIFNNPTLKKRKLLKDWMLAMGVAFLVIIDVAILSVYTIVEGVSGQLSSNKVPNRENTEDVIGVLQVTYRYFAFVCNSRSRYITLGILYGYKALLQIVALILAVSIRKVQIKGLNDAVYIIAAIYVTSIVTTVIVVSTYTLVEFVNIYAVVFSLCLFIGTTVILILVFVPPLINLYKDPGGTSIFKTPEVNQTGKSSIASNSKATISYQRKRIKELEMELLETKSINL